VATKNRPLVAKRFPTAATTRCSHVRPRWSAVTYFGAMAVSRSRKARAARRRKHRMDRVDHDLSDEQWTALKAAWGGCAYCGDAGQPLQRDCVLALSRGGRYTLDNVVPACRSCNTSKCNDEVTSWLRRKRLDESAFLLRHLEINRALALRFRTEASDTLGP
jgi:5-methylcytosine-specific restriction endonuclease McrA